MMESLEAAREVYGTGYLLAVSGLIIGLVFGVVAELSAFCTRAAVAEWAHDETQTHGTRTTAILAAVLVALLGTQAMHWAGIVDLSQTLFWTSEIRPLALVLGGLLFGIGMVLTGGCISRLLVLAASGNMRSWITLTIAATAAYATLRGILSYPRIWLENAWNSEVNVATLLGEGYGIGIAAACVVIALVLIAIANRVRFRSVPSGKALVAGMFIGLLVVGGWLATGVVGFDEFEPTPLTSLSFVAPIGESLQFLMIFTGDTFRFSIALVTGVLVGAFASSIVGGRFRFQGFKTETSIMRYALGAVLMGFGGVTALGCTIGQGLSGVSTASPASMLAIIAIVSGAYSMMRWQVRQNAAPQIDTLSSVLRVTTPSRLSQSVLSETKSCLIGSVIEPVIK